MRAFEDYSSQNYRNGIAEERENPWAGRTRSQICRRPQGEAGEAAGGFPSLFRLGIAILCAEKTKKDRDRSESGKTFDFIQENPFYSLGLTRRGIPFSVFRVTVFGPIWHFGIATRPVSHPSGKKRSAGSEDPADFERGQSLQGTKQYKPAVSQGVKELQDTKCAGGEKKPWTTASKVKEQNTTRLLSFRQHPGGPLCRHHSAERPWYYVCNSSFIHTHCQ